MLKRAIISTLRPTILNMNASMDNLTDSSRCVRCSLFVSYLKHILHYILTATTNNNPDFPRVTCDCRADINQLGMYAFLNVFFNGSKLERVTSEKLLGLTIDESKLLVIALCFYQNNNHI